MNIERILKYCLILIMLIVNKSFAQIDVIYSDIELLAKLKSDLDNEYIKDIIKIADSYLNKDIKTITSHPSPLGEDYLHDYFSEGPYWWPDDSDESKPYIRRDGERNPNRFTAHKESMMEMYQGLTSLSIAAYLTNNKIYSDKAVEIINKWFIDEQTKMAPHLKYAQMIRNKETVRGVGIIETHRFVGLIESLIMLKKTNFVKEEIWTQLGNWLKKYYLWLTESDWGIDEKERGNNHSSWWAAQSASIAYYLGFMDDLNSYYEYGSKLLIDNQFDSECRQPLEDERTLSLSYNTFNLNALSFLSASLLKVNLNLFDYKNASNCSLLDVARRINIYIENPSTWELKQIKKFNVDTHEYIALIALCAGQKDFVELYKRLLDSKLTKKELNESDPFDILLSAQVSVIQ